MPGWNMHLEAGERLADRLEFSGKKRKAFLLGCLLPDLNNGYANRVEIKKPHRETHFAYDEKSSLNFYAKYKDKIDAKEPIYLGYLFHLYTDGYFNYDFYRKIKYVPLGEGLDRDEKLKIKQRDFWLYDMNFEHSLRIQNESELNELVAKANEISTVEITPEEIMNVEEILQSDDLRRIIRGKEYLFYTKERLDEVLDEMIQSFCKDYLGEKNAGTA